MTKCALLINGISLPYIVIENTIKWAQKAKSGIKVVFMYASKDERHHHHIPLNLPMTKSLLMEVNGEMNLVILIKTHMDYIQKQCNTKQVPVAMVIMKNPVISDIENLVQDVQVIFLDLNTFSHPGDFAYLKFPYESFDQQLLKKVQS